MILIVMQYLHDEGIMSKNDYRGLNCNENHSMAVNRGQSLFNSICITLISNVKSCYAICYHTI